MPHNPELRASDGDRDRVAEALREHHAVGRLDADEFQDRLEATYRAKTLGELETVTADLPAQDLYAGLPVPADQRAHSGPRPGRRTRSDRPRGRMFLRGAWATWASVSAICVVIWLLTMIGHGWEYPWPVWVAGPWGAVMLAGQLFGGDDHHHHDTGGRRAARTALRDRRN